MLTVACVCVPGGIYDTTHVLRLQRQVEEHMRQPFKFHIILQSDKPGWFAKIDLFQPGFLRGRVLYLDLDVTITGNLDDLADFEGSFCIMRDPNLQLSFNSSVMAWDAGAADHLYLDFVPDHHIPKLRRGDQQWITEQKPEAATFPRTWLVSYKRAMKNNEWPDDMRVCVYHGRPKPWSEGVAPIPEKYRCAA